MSRWVLRVWQETEIPFLVLWSRADFRFLLRRWASRSAVFWLNILLMRFSVCFTQVSFKILSSQVTSWNLSVCETSFLFMFECLPVRDYEKGETICVSTATRPFIIGWLPSLLICLISRRAGTVFYFNIVRKRVIFMSWISYNQVILSLFFTCASLIHMLLQLLLIFTY